MQVVAVAQLTKNSLLKGMPGKKVYQKKLFNIFQLSDRNAIAAPVLDAGTLGWRLCLQTRAIVVARITTFLKLKLSQVISLQTACLDFIGSIYKGGPDGFEYIKEQDHYHCLAGKVIPFKKVFNDNRARTKKKEYRILSEICRECRFRKSCLGKTAKEKKFSVTQYCEEY